MNYNTILKDAARLLFGFRDALPRPLRAGPLTVTLPDGSEGRLCLCFRADVFEQICLHNFLLTSSNVVEYRNEVAGYRTLFGAPVTVTREPYAPAVSLVVELTDPKYYPAPSCPVREDSSSHPTPPTRKPPFTQEEMFK